MNKFAFAALAVIVLAGCGQTPTSTKVAKKATATKAASAKAVAAKSTAATADKGLAGMFRLAHAHLDANADGQLDAAEYAVAIEEEVIPGLPALSALDKDGDGLISMAEFTHKDFLKGKAALFTERVQADFAGLDGNKDKALNKQEMTESDVTFQAADADKNGKVTIAEFERALAEALNKPAK